MQNSNSCVFTKKYLVGEAGFDYRANLFFLHKNAFAFLATPKSFVFCAFRLSVSFFFPVFSRKERLTGDHPVISRVLRPG